MKGTLLISAELLVAWLAGAAFAGTYLFSFMAEDSSVFDLVQMTVHLGLLWTLIGGALVVLFVWRRAARLAEGKVAIALPFITAAIVGIVAGAALVVGRRNIGATGEVVLFVFALVVAAWVWGAARSLRTPRQRRLRLGVGVLGTVGLLMLGPGLSLRSAEFLEADADNGVVTAIGHMSVARSGHTATILPDGRILLAGGMVSVQGVEECTAATDLFDPVTNGVSCGPDMLMPRAGHTATLLPSGELLITGGMANERELASAEVLSVHGGSSRMVEAMTVTRERHAATLLHDGRVLVTGGTIVRPSESADLFDPASGGFVPVSPMLTKRAAHTSTLLPDGRVLVAGGADSPTSVLATAEVFDPSTGRFLPAGSMTAQRYKHAAVDLPDGRVVMVCGSDARDWNGRRSSVEVFDPGAGRFTPVSNTHRSRFKLPAAAAILTDGRMAVAGGGRRVEVVDLETGVVGVAAGTLRREWFYSTATRLLDGRLLIAGGYHDGLRCTDQMWVYTPAAGTRRVTVGR